MLRIFTFKEGYVLIISLRASQKHNCHLPSSLKTLYDDAIIRKVGINNLHIFLHAIHRFIQLCTENGHLSHHQAVLRQPPLNFDESLNAETYIEACKHKSLIDRQKCYLHLNLVKSKLTKP